MKLFEPIYARCLHWARLRYAPLALFGLSLIEAVIFPLPPETMLAPMCLARPFRAWWYASISLAGSMIGMFIGYALGYFAIDWAMPLIEAAGYGAKFGAIQQDAAENGFWLLLLAGFTPVPFKIFTIASGAVGMPLLPFALGALIGRGKRVYLVAGAIRFGGLRAEHALRRHVETIGWVASALLVGLILWLALR